MLTAKQILDQKGYTPTKFDTNAFLLDVAEYFLNAKVEDKLYLYKFRFLDIKWEKIDDKEWEFSTGENLTREDVNRGYKNCSNKWRLLFQKDESVGVIECRNYSSIYFGNKKTYKENGAFDPLFLIDEPFFKNAVGLLRVMGGYVVQREKKDKYCVTLI